MEPTRVLGIDEGAGTILALVAALRAERAIVGIAGPVGAGKSTLAERLTPCVVRTDDYLPDYDTVAYPARDLPEHADLAGLASHLRALRRGLPVEIPTWSFKTHRRESARTLSPKALIACEGIHALHATVRPALDIAVYVDAPRDRRWARWEAIEAAGERGWGVEQARAYFDGVAEPTFLRFADEYRRAAHVIVVNG